MKLKTLKDISFKMRTYLASEIETIEKDAEKAMEFKEKIRQEAIKWVKEMSFNCAIDLSKLKLEWDGQPIKYDEELYSTEQATTYAQIVWIIAFFNINEVELK